MPRRYNNRIKYNYFTAIVELYKILMLFCS